MQILSLVIKDCNNKKKGGSELCEVKFLLVSMNDMSLFPFSFPIVSSFSPSLNSHSLTLRIYKSEL